MKRISLVFIAVVAVTGTCFSQGTILFKNFGTGAGATSVSAPIYNVDGTTGLVGSGFSVQLYAGNDLGSLAPIGTPHTPFISLGGGLFPGYFDAGSVAVTGFATGTTPLLQVRAWDNGGGALTTWEAASIRGASTAFTSPALGDSGQPPNIATIPVPQGLTSFSLALVPEPSVVALGILGAAAVIFRRRKS